MNCTDKNRSSLSSKISDLWQDPEYVKKQQQARKGHPGTTTGKRCITDGLQDKFVLPEDIQPYLDAGWWLGCKKKGKPATTTVWNKGLTKYTDERVKKNGEAVSKSLIGNIPWNTGLTSATDDRVKRCAESQIGKVITAEHREKISKANRGRKQSVEEIQSRRLSLIEFYVKHPEARKLRSEQMKDRYKDPELRKKCSDQVKLAHKNDPTIVLRGIETKRVNGTFNVSAPEKEYYELLIQRYGEEDVFTQYNKDPRYPFACDFYIKSEDLFIELNIHPTHHTHPFNPDDEEDVRFLEVLQARNDQWSRNIVDVWTKRDYNKMQTAIKNNLNYKAVYENGYAESRDSLEERTGNC